jgi:putative acetyltransferase
MSVRVSGGSVGGDDITVRDYRAGDIQAMIDIFRGAVRLIARRDYTQAQVLAWAPDVIDADLWAKGYATTPAFIAEIDGKAVGFTDLESDGHLDMMYVHPDFQRRGVATALLGRVESVALRAGIHELRTEASITARPFFERRGFCIVAPQVVSIRGQDFVNYQMKKSLGP